VNRRVLVIAFVGFVLVDQGRAFIALEAETAPTDLRSVELLNLDGCTDPKARNYRTYLVNSNASKCR